MVSVQPPCAIAYINIRVHIKTPKHWHPYIVWTHRNATHIDRHGQHYSYGCRALASKATQISTHIDRHGQHYSYGCRALPSKATQISHKGLRSTEQNKT